MRSFWRWLFLWGQGHLQKVRGGRVYAASIGVRGLFLWRGCCSYRDRRCGFRSYDTPLSGSTVKAIGSPWAGDRRPESTESKRSLLQICNVFSSHGNKVNELDARSITLAEKSHTDVIDEDYDTPLRIVEAEAGSEDIKGRVLRVNVIMNRVKAKIFRIRWQWGCLGITVTAFRVFTGPMMVGSMKLQFRETREAQAGAGWVPLIILKVHRFLYPENLQQRNIMEMVWKGPARLFLNTGSMNFIHINRKNWCSIEGTNVMQNRPAVSFYLKAVNICLITGWIKRQILFKKWWHFP